ncbi:hypothetical protein [Leptolyngbya sp. FACHB-8]|uniref:hypothetical protein n=1 Tax=unclassified Leptolyngbya TaxID=2650499 RepID=UPI0016883140|nr:hypothetical protein [Leptolyngbya sp. FACHB-8]MBD1911260.1 hypothetical protein [Leptolyngbya sp. FACHB-8]
MKRFQRLIQPASAVIITASVVGAIAGLNYALHSRFTQLNRAYRVESAEWNKYTGEVFTLLPHLALTVAVFTAIGIILSPEPPRNERRTLAALARRKLSQEVLTESELQQWSAILQEAERHES